MIPRSVDWTPLRAGDSTMSKVEGLRERKKRLTRQQLSDTATELFLERGFDAVRVAEIAATCGVSEKTVYNYFPTKESLLLDRWDSTTSSLLAGLADRAAAPVDVARRILDEELGALMAWLRAQTDPAAAVAQYLRFGELIRGTPALRAYQRDAVDQLVAGASEVLARRLGMRADGPVPGIAAIAIVGLWDVQARSLHRRLGGKPDPARIRRSVRGDVARAAAVIDTGLSSLATTR